jgi:flagellar biogenesis protein FliO
MRFPSIAIFTAFAALAVPAMAAAAVNLKQVQVSTGGRVDLLFDGRISRSQIKTEFFNDIIQLSLTDAAVYPAKISSVSGGDLTKVFAYQYAPKLVRCRLSVKGKAEDFRSRLILDQKGNVLTIRFDGSVDSIASHAATAVRAQVAAKGKAKPTVKAPEADSDDSDPGERALLERILSHPKPAEAEKAAEAKADLKSDSKAEAARAPAQAAATIQREATPPIQGPPTEALATGKPLLSPVRMLIKMLAVIALFGICAMGLRKLMMASGNTRKGGALGRLLQRGMSKYGKAGKMIEVVSTHHLGPKKSIAVVRVAGRNLVLGISQDSINLITQLGPEGDGSTEAELDDLDLEALGVRGGPSISAPRAGARAPAGASAFDSVLSTESGRPSFDSAEQAALPPPEANGVRARIRSRLEGMKPL